MKWRERETPAQSSTYWTKIFGISIYGAWMV